MSQNRRNSLNIDLGVQDRLCSEGVPKGMKTSKREFFFFTKLSEPVIRAVRMHRLPVPPNKKPICFNPLVAAVYTLRVVFKLELFQLD